MALGGRSHTRLVKRKEMEGARERELHFPTLFRPHDRFPRAFKQPTDLSADFLMLDPSGSQRVGAFLSFLAMLRR
jgi:hypothetical protein